MTRRMSTGMQQWSIGRMLAGTRWDSEVYDVKANLDRTLTYNENAANIRHQLGITTRNRGLEQHHQGNEERARERQRRKNPMRQVGFSNEGMDRLLHAHPPGKRRSANGRRYYEYRQNRSDIPPGRI